MMAGAPQFICSRRSPVSH